MTISREEIERVTRAHKVAQESIRAEVAAFQALQQQVRQAAYDVIDQGRRVTRLPDPYDPYRITRWALDGETLKVWYASCLDTGDFPDKNPLRFPVRWLGQDPAVWLPELQERHALFEQGKKRKQEEQAAALLEARREEARAFLLRYGD